MNYLDTADDQALTKTTPLFASVWLALFNVLRRNYYEWRLATNDDMERP